MEDQCDSLCPIFYESDSSKFKHVGTGVLVEFRGFIFLLTAGHVIDYLSKGDNGALMVPIAGNEITSIEGTFSSYKQVEGRQSDMMDYGYFKLDNDFAEKMKCVFCPVKEEDFHITEFIPSHDLFSFSGFPYRKSKISILNARTELFSYGAYLASPEEYKKYGCNPRYHVVAKYNRKNSINSESREKQLPPLPHGISGGGVFVWPSEPTEIPPKNRKLGAIGHTYKEREGILIGTNLLVVLKSILYNNPELES